MKTRMRTLSVGSPTGKLQAGETRRDDPAAFDLRHDEAEAIERMADLVAGKAETDDRAAGVFDRGKFRGEFGIAWFEELRGGVGGESEDQGVK